MTATAMRHILAAMIATLTLTACATIDSIFGPPTPQMNQSEMQDYCIKWPQDNFCQRWFAGEFKDGFPK